MKTKLEIINETVEYYQGHPERRSLVNGKCVYFGKTEEQMCAFGRCIKPEFKERIVLGTESLNFNTLTAASLALNLSRIADEISNVNNVVKPEYKGNDLNFWMELQQLHDDSDCWDSQAQLTVDGKTYLETLQKRYING